jgi:hypothetical protein
MWTKRLERGRFCPTFSDDGATGRDPETFFFVEVIRFRCPTRLTR